MDGLDLTVTFVYLATDVVSYTAIIIMQIWEGYKINDLINQFET